MRRLVFIVQKFGTMHGHIDIDIRGLEL